jgi:hypothetical protein
MADKEITPEAQEELRLAAEAYKAFQESEAERLAEITERLGNSSDHGFTENNSSE